MLTVEKLENAGADTKDGIARCAGNEAFYLKIAGMVITNEGYEQLKKSIEDNDLNAAFEAAHALKGLVGNASLTPLYKSVCDITELLRARTEMDYTDMVNGIMDQVAAYRALMED